MASGGSAGRDAYDEEAGGRRPLELDGRDAAAAAASSSDHRPGELEFVSSSPGGVAVWLRRDLVRGCGFGFRNWENFSLSSDFVWRNRRSS